MVRGRSALCASVVIASVALPTLAGVGGAATIYCSSLIGLNPCRVPWDQQHGGFVCTGNDLTCWRDWALGPSPSAGPGLGDDGGGYDPWAPIKRATDEPLEQLEERLPDAWREFGKAWRESVSTALQTHRTTKEKAESAEEHVAGEARKLQTSEAVEQAGEIDPVAPAVDTPQVPSASDAAAALARSALGASSGLVPNDPCGLPREAVGNLPGPGAQGGGSGAPAKTPCLPEASGAPGTALGQQQAWDADASSEPRTNPPATVEVRSSTAAALPLAGTGAEPLPRGTQQLASARADGPASRDSPGSRFLSSLSLALLLLPAVLILYRRLLLDDALAHPLRCEIFDAIASRPGETAGGIARRFDVERRTALHHLAVLRDFGLVTPARVGKRLRYFLNGGTYRTEQMQACVALSNANARAIAALLLARPGMSLTHLTEVSGLPKTTVQGQLARLRRLGTLAPDGTVDPSAAEWLRAAAPSGP